MQLGRGGFQIVFDLLQAELVRGPLIPLGFAIKGVEQKAKLLRLLAPVRALGHIDPLHDPLDRDE